MTSVAEPQATVAAQPGRTPSSQPSLEYQPSLDGLRALAVLLVMLYHADVSWAHGGFLGVDIFFVLSGYLITSLLLVEWGSWGGLDLPAFWLRRARRLLPALFLVVGVVGLAAPLFSDRQVSRLRIDGLATLGYVANWRFIFSGQSYFDRFSSPSPFRHMWSLGIEEQFYWIFPVVFGGLLLVARKRRLRLTVLLLVLAVVSALWMVLLLNHAASSTRLYYGTDTRIQTLLVGAALAVLVYRLRHSPGLPPSGVRWGLVESVVGAGGLVAILWLSYDRSPWLYDGGFLVVAACVALLLDGLRRAPVGPVSAAMSWRPVVLVGLISYGLYLWHWPLFLLLDQQRTHLSGAPLVVVRFVATGAFASASYVWLERPIRNGALSRFSHGQVWMVFAGSVALVIGCLLIGTKGALPVAPIESTGTFETRIVAPSPGQKSLLVVGDSPGRFLSWYLPRDVLSGYAISESTSIGCGLMPQTVIVGSHVTEAQPQCEGWLTAWRDAAASAQADAVLLSTGYWELFDKQVGDQRLRLGTPEYSQALLAQLDAVRSATSAGHVPLIILNVPCMGGASFVVDGAELANEANDPARQAQVNQILEDFASRHPDDVRVLDYRSFLCPTGEYQADLDGVADVRPDGVHLGGPGGRLVGEWLRPQLDALLQGRPR